ncbi:MAG: 2-C-methyl-D-erythritol 2,4-cyclodiphosphate synthase [Candidatus Paraimprobicoccus trichonymphae]|uniref:2-C-methyl-D-erythritol 2,4-cyclodiphosphate synthase n=1 Tax=Candidatus Paraimprobicoccus trichonymphae TaxID=3033793 RepID=A0AA48IAJ0_9FIRM|nr:MAG: 2-C-methyl-D-erythritol 2,4-cyclodiphosphate synthase [Candidatus Paraimprobicoccus trichonymphae]
MRIGHGYDAHKLVYNRNLILGGVKIDYFKGLMGNSDADVLVHTIVDSLLGAACLGDIGKLFPDVSSDSKNFNSLNLLRTVYKLVDKKYKLINIDSIIIAQKPKLEKYIFSMRENISNILKTDIDNVSIKATTEEKMGFTGNLIGISAHTVCLIK